MYFYDSGVRIGILSRNGRIGGRGFHWLELDGAKGGHGMGDRGAGWARFIDERRELLLPGGSELDEDAEGAPGAEHSGKIVQCEGDEKSPSGPLREAGEPGGDDHSEGDEVGLAEEDRNRGGEHGGDANSGKVEEENHRGDGVEGEGKGAENGEEDGSAHGGDNEEGGEPDVVSEEAGEAVVVEDDEKSGDSRDKGHEGGGVE